MPLVPWNAFSNEKSTMKLFEFQAYSTHRKLLVLIHK